MLQILYKYLILNNKVVIPGVGLFYLRRQPAYLDYSNKTFVAPSAEINFTANNAEADKRFYSFLSVEKQIEEVEAERVFDGFSKTIKDSLIINGKVDLPGMGVLAVDEAGIIQLVAPLKIVTVYNNIPAEPTIRKSVSTAPVEEAKINSEEAVSVAREPMGGVKGRSYWWIFAIVLAVAAVVAIVYYYLQNGTLR